MSTYKHISVLPREVIDYLNIKPGGTYIDATFGGGGHTRAILEANPTCKIIAFDWDKEAIEHNAPKLSAEYGDRFSVIFGNFAHCYKLLTSKKITSVDGVLADFGTSQHQIHNEDGFSFATNTPLDMRMSKGHHYFSAKHIVNRFTEKEIADIIFEYGEDRFARRIARAIVLNREHREITHTQQLADIVFKAVPKKPHVRLRIHPATKTFQALRIFVNKELENIEAFLRDIPQLIKPDGRLVCISFHSLEDRIVKHYFKRNPDLFITETKKPVTAAEDELEENPSARSAKLRCGKKKQKNSVDKKS